MNLNEYMKQAKTTDLDLPLEYYYAGLAEETGEIMGLRKRLLRGDYSADYHPFDFDRNLVNEMGDLLWYWIMLCHKHSLNPEYIMDVNLTKLKRRKEEGKIHGKGDNR